MGWSALLWAVPVCAAAVAFAVVLAWSRRLEVLSRALVVEVHRLPEVRTRLALLRDELGRGEAATAKVWRHWSPADPVAGPTSVPDATRSPR
jgi:hypothetical protein